MVTALKWPKLCALDRPDLASWSRENGVHRFRREMFESNSQRRDLRRLTVRLSLQTTITNSMNGPVTLALWRMVRGFS